MAAIPDDPGPIVHALHTAERLDGDPVAVVETSGTPKDERSNLERKADAGAALYFALHHSTAEVVKALPLPVLRALGTAGTAFHPDR